MIAVIFEVEINPAHMQEYLDIAARLRPQLEKIDGFISVERFQSLTDEKKLLSLSFFRDESAVTRWRNIQDHQNAQNKGRTSIFNNYRLRVAGIIRDYGMLEREQAPFNSSHTRE
jgi:heme-degrading monooxygenase HmoA